MQIREARGKRHKRQTTEETRTSSGEEPQGTTLRNCRSRRRPRNPPPCPRTPPPRTPPPRTPRHLWQQGETQAQCMPREADFARPLPRARHVFDDLCCTAFSTDGRAHRREAAVAELLMDSLILFHSGKMAGEKSLTAVVSQTRSCRFHLGEGDLQGLATRGQPSSCPLEQIVQRHHFPARPCLGGRVAPL